MRCDTAPHNAIKYWLGNKKGKVFVFTLNVKRDRTFSCKTSVIARSKFAKIFMASWGSMRFSVIRSSRVSVKAAPTLRGGWC